MASLLSYARGVRERLAPLRSTSAFQERGVLTPEEFIAAGDMLVFKCPTWTWEAGDPSKTKSYLPKDKQYLMTRGVPCLRRIKSLEDDYVGEEELIEGEDQWVQPRVVSHVGGPTDLDDQEGFGFVGGGGEIEGEVKCQQRVSEMSASVVHNHFDVAAAAESGSTGSAQDGAYPDLDSFVEDNVLGEDDATLVEAPYLKAEEPADDGILQFRRYDLSITYDKYYQTPRMWLLGYGEDGTPLSGENMFEDIMDDYAHQTVTIEAHPHESLHHASIHPCKHAHVMHRMIERLTAAGRTPRVDQYLFIFLKFLQSVVPTINYDFTMSL